MPLLENPPGTRLRTVVWRDLADQGSDYCSLWQQTGGWLFRGTAITVVEDGRPMLVSYEVACDLLWHTRHVAVECNIGSERNSVVLTVDSSGAWHSPTEERPTLRDCTDIDLAVSPATNTIPIRRLNLEVGQSRDVVAAWLKFPHLALETLSQRYTRLDSQRYLYQTSAGFSADLLVDDLGLIALYPGGWERVASF